MDFTAKKEPNQKIRPKKSLGQNFLTDQKTLEKIVFLKDLKNKQVLEIGLGQGGLTRLLSREAKKVVCYEIDRGLVDRFFQNSKNHKNSNIEIINQDFLEADFKDQEKQVVVANIPYYITSDILFKIFDNHPLFTSCVVMLQEEVANRLIAKTGTKNYGKLTMTTNLFAKNVKKHFVVKPGSFHPRPKVNSAVVSFDLRENIKEAFGTKEFIKKMFLFRRKTIFNNLRKNGLTTEEITNLILKTNQKIRSSNSELCLLRENLRPQNLSLEHVLLVYEEFKKTKK